MRFSTTKARMATWSPKKSTPSTHRLRSAAAPGRTWNQFRSASPRASAQPWSFLRRSQSAATGSCQSGASDGDGSGAFRFASPVPPFAASRLAIFFRALATSFFSLGAFALGSFFFGGAPRLGRSSRSAGCGGASLTSPVRPDSPTRHSLAKARTARSSSK